MTFYYFFWTTVSFTILLIIVHHYKLECLVKRLDCCVQGQGHSKGSAFHCLFDIFWTAHPFVTKLGMVMHHHRPECHVERLSSQSRSQWGLIQSDITISTVCTELLILLQPNLIGWYIIISGVSCVNIWLLWRFKTSLNHDQFCISVQWYLCYQTRCVDVLLLKAIPSTKWSHADSNTMIYSITRL